MANSCRAFSTGGFVYGHRRDPMHHAGHLDWPDRDLSDRRGPDRRSGHDLVCRGRARRAHRRHVPRAAVAAARVVFRRVNRGLRRDAPAGEKIYQQPYPAHECRYAHRAGMSRHGGYRQPGRPRRRRHRRKSTGPPARRPMPPSPPGLRPSCCASRASSSSSHPPA